MQRCEWPKNDKKYIQYHDTEWGITSRDDQHHFEHLILEGAQAGLSWLTILRRRENYRNAYQHFDPKTVAAFNEQVEASLLHNEGIIRNRLKIKASIKNAQVFLEIQFEFGSFSNYIWQFVDNKKINNTWTQQNQIPAVSAASIALSNDLKKRGMKFVGPTIMYAHMQATGLINDHLVHCFRYNMCKE